MVTDTKTVWGEGETNPWTLTPSEPIFNRYAIQYYQANCSHVAGVSVTLLRLGQHHPMGMTTNSNGRSKYWTSSLVCMVSAESKISFSRLLSHEELSVISFALHVALIRQVQDLTFELRSNNFRWRWETYNQGPKISANVISQHLVLPLISLNHLAFSTAESLSETSEGNLEKVKPAHDRRILSHADAPILT